MLWGECRGSAVAPHRTVVDLAGPAYRCSCPSRKFPCQHVLALLLLWPEEAVKDDPGGPPDWAASWLAARAGKAGHAPAREPADPKTAAKRAEYREARVAIGLAELDRWLCDQVRQGLAASQRAGYSHWDDIGARMVDAQAPGPAERLRNLGITGAVVQDPVSDRVVWQEYLETVVRERDDWSDFYRACRDAAG